MTESTPTPDDPQTNASNTGGASQPNAEHATGGAGAGSPLDPPPAAEFDPATLTDDEKTMALLAHMLAIIGGVIAPLIIWLIKKDQSKFVDDQGKESLNFQITVLIGFTICVLAGCLTFCVGGIGALLAFPLYVVDIVFCIIAGIKAREGVAYRYPFNIRFIR